VICRPEGRLSKTRATVRSHDAGKGTQAPKIKEKFNCCHLVSQLTATELP
jgi:hypothetical protein